MNHLVLSGTKTIVPSGTEASCYRGLKLQPRRWQQKFSPTLNFTNVLTLTSCCVSIACEQLARRCGQDALCVYSLTRKPFLQCDSFFVRTRAHVAARATAPSSTSSGREPEIASQRVAAIRAVLSNIAIYRNPDGDQSSRSTSRSLTSVLPARGETQQQQQSGASNNWGHDRERPDAG